MKMDEIYEKLKEIFREVFDNPEIEVTPEMTADDIEEWDSMTHMNLIMMVELRFGIEFEQREVMRFENVGDLAYEIRKRR
jgi:acyl carrier protein